MGNFLMVKVSNKDKPCTEEVRDTLKTKPVPTEAEVRAFFYGHDEEHGYAVPKQMDWIEDQEDAD